MGNNDGDYAREERHFDCDWLSSFPEESERLWMGGRAMQKLESVRVVETKNNYRKFLRAFHLFDCLLSADWPSYKTKVKKADIRIVRGAVSEYLGVGRNGYHSFVNDMFSHFCARKTQIKLSLWQMDKWIKNEEFV